MGDISEAWGRREHQDSGEKQLKHGFEPTWLTASASVGNDPCTFAGPVVASAPLRLLLPLGVGLRLVVCTNLLYCWARYLSVVSPGRPCQVLCFKGRRAMGTSGRQCMETGGRQRMKTWGRRPCHVLAIEIGKQAMSHEAIRQKMRRVAGEACKTWNSGNLRRELWKYRASKPRIRRGRQAMEAEGRQVKET